VSTTINIAPGTAMPSGTETIRAWEDGVLRSIIGAPASTGEPHPLWALTGAIRGLGTDIDGILGFADATAADGPMVASCDIEYLQPLRYDVEYQVHGKVLGLERKVGRKTGPFDLYTFELSLNAGGAVATRITFVWVVPRRDADGD
jgi:hypothetical protein